MTNSIMENTSYDMLHNVNHNNCNHMIYSIWVYDLLTYDILRAHVDWSNFVQNIGFDKTEKSNYYYILHSFCCKMFQKDFIKSFIF